MIAEIVNEDGHDYLWFWCAGCHTHHRVPVTGPKKWEWNGSVEKPTLKPSILITYSGVRSDDVPVHKVCHSYVTDGRIQYISDSTHALSGQTVDLEVLP